MNTMAYVGFLGFVISWQCQISLDPGSLNPETLKCLPIVPLLDRKGSTGKPLLKTFYNRSRKAN
jgi:hypothetical protein